MDGRLWKAVLTLALLAVFPTAARAQGTVPDAPQLTDLSPPSGQRGAAVEVQLTGQKLEGTKQLLVRYSAFPDLVPPVERGVRAEVLSAAGEQVKARLTIAPDAPPGLHQVRAVTAQGLTPPQYFYVAQYPQVPEKEGNNSVREANPLSLPATVAGTIGGNEDRDTFSFTARAGQTLVLEVEGFKRFAPPQAPQEGFTYLDAFLVLQDASGRELAYDDDGTRLDSLLAYRFTADGTYYATIRDSLYRGRGDFHYRLTVAERPTISAIFPAGGGQGTRLISTVYGHNLGPAGATTTRQAISLPSSPGFQEFRISTPAGASNAVPVAAGNLFEATEAEPNDRVQDATQVQVPVTCSGKFDSLGDVDGFRFQAQGGQTLVLQVTAGKLGSPADTHLTLMDRSGQVIGRDDDGGGMPDARLQVQIPRTDEYAVFVRNQTRTGSGPAYFYRLTIRTLQPTFTATCSREGTDRRGGRVNVPVDCLPVPQGGSLEFRVELTRREGQSGDVAIVLNAPPTVKGMKLEQVVRTPAQGNQPAKETVTPNPVIKNGQTFTLLRLSADAAGTPPGTYSGVYLELKGLAGAQPFTLREPVWLTVVPK